MNSFPHSIDIIPGALLFVVSDAMDVEITRRIARIVDEIDGLQHAGIIEIIPSYGSILVVYDISILSGPQVTCLLSEGWERTVQTGAVTNTVTVTIDVVYGETFGDDLANVSANTGRSIDEVITLHVSGQYTVGAVGFSPGFTYLIGLPPGLAIPRRSTPRLRVPAGSVGIGGDQTGVYALESSGGWTLIGRSPTRLFDPTADPPVRLRLGDSVEFRQVDSADFGGIEQPEPMPQGDGPIEIVAPGLQTTVQDLGRYGVARYGFATDGAADRASLASANRMLGNPIGAAALEVAYHGPTLRFQRRMGFAIVGADLGARLNGRLISPGRGFETMPGAVLEFNANRNTSGARAYLAVKGGFDVPLVMGSASTNLIAKVGGWHGRALMRGDRLSPGQLELPASMFTPGMSKSTDVTTDKPFRVVAGPQRDRFDDATWDRLLQSEFTVSDDVNRVGMRLLGPSLAPRAGADTLSEGIVTGSIQVTGEGQAIVMLPGHATIGGYTKIATVIAGDWDRLGQLSPGDVVRFTGVD